MASLKYVLTSKFNNIKAIYKDNKIEIGIMLFHSKTRDMVKLSEYKIKIAENNEASYFITKLNLKNDSNNEMVYMLEDYIYDESGSYTPIFIGWFIDGNIVLEKKVKNTNGSIGGCRFDSYLERVGKPTKYFNQSWLVYER